MLHIQAERGLAVRARSLLSPIPGRSEAVAAGSCDWVHPEAGETAISVHVHGGRFGRACRNRYRPDGTVLAL